MPDLQQCRKVIDEIDKEIVRLFEKRMEVSTQVAEYKLQVGKPVLDPQRESEKRKAVRELACNGLNQQAVDELFQQIMASSRKKQYQLLVQNQYQDQEAWTGTFVEKLPLKEAKVVFQGVEGAYSYAAMRTYFGDSIQSFHVKTWKDAVDAVQKGEADYAVLPIENSTAGIVADIYDLLMEYDLYIAGEQIIRCQHALLGVKGASLEDIRTVYSHPQALSQCKRFLQEHPLWKQVPWENTAGSAKKICEDKDKSQAAIASLEAARFYNLDVLKEQVYYNSANCTRFIIVGNQPVFQKDAGKISICFELPHETGSLYKMLSHIIYNGLNMTKIESRPIPGKNWQYRFFVDFEGNLTQPEVKNALLGIRQEADLLKILGNYQQEGYECE